MILAIILLNQNGITAFIPSYHNGNDSGRNRMLRSPTFFATMKTTSPSALSMTLKSHSSRNDNLVQDFMNQTCQMLKIAAIGATLLFCDPSSSFAGDDLGTGGKAIIGQEASKMEAVTPAPDNSMEEVYKLVSKYYIGRSNSQDNLNNLHDQYAKILGKGEGDPMELATKLTKSLGDKYSRTLSVGNYERMQKYDLIGVGAMFMPNQDGQIIVGAPPVPSSAADKAG